MRKQRRCEFQFGETCDARLLVFSRQIKIMSEKIEQVSRIVMIQSLLLPPNKVQSRKELEKCRVLMKGNSEPV